MQKKYYYFLPNTFTALNMGCGYLSIMYSYQHQFTYACLILVLGALFDSVDGRVARLTNTQSSFGEQFDSLSDLISFGVAPSLLLYFYNFNQLGRLGIFISFLYLLAGALRLARFNANIEKVDSAFFQGLPIPSGAVAIVGYVLFNEKYHLFDNYVYLVALYALTYSFLMISNIPFNSFKNSEFIHKKKKLIFLLLIIIIGLTFVYFKILVITLINLYVLFSIIYYFKNKNKFGDIFLSEEK